MHGGHGAVGVGEGAKQLRVGRRVLSDGVDKAELGNEARGSQGIGPVRDEGADRHDDERPSGRAIVGGGLQPQDDHGKPGHGKE